MVSTDQVRYLEPLTKEECIFLADQHPAHIGRIAIGGARPVILPVNYAVDRNEIVFRTAAGTKLDAAIDKAFVAFEIDDVDPDWRMGWSVLFRGQIKVVTDEAEIDRLSQLPLKSWAEIDDQRFVRIHNPLVSGRKLR